MDSKKIDDLSNIFSEIVSNCEKNNLYCDCNYFKKKEQRVIVTKEDTLVNDDGDEGVKIRVWDGETFQEYGTNSLNREEIIKDSQKIIDNALKNAQNNSNYKELKVDKTQMNKDFLPEFKLEKGLEEKHELLKEMKDKILSSRESIINAKVGVIEEIEENLFVNSYKRLYQKIPINIYVNIANILCENESVRDVFDAYSNSNFDDAYQKGVDNFENFLEKIDSMYKAKKLKGGKYTVLLSPKLSGLLAHESFGHGMEADTMMKNRALSNHWLNQKIGRDDVSIVDYSSIGGKNGQLYFDHEGNLARETYLVKNGIIKEPMSDLYSKTKLDLEHSNNGRFESFDHKHYTRMSNTYFMPGESSFKELLGSIENGILITDSSGGMEDPQGWGVQVQGNFGQKIENGKLVDEFYDGFTLTGFLPDIIKNIEGISKEFEIEGAGLCGKGHKEWVRVSEGGPYLLIKDVMLG